MNFVDFYRFLPALDPHDIETIFIESNRSKNCHFLSHPAAINQQILQNVNQSWQTLANPANSVDYSSHLLSATLPISIQHFLKYSESIKKESSMAGAGISSNANGMENGSSNNIGAGFNLKADFLNLKNGVGSNLNLALSGSSGVPSSNSSAGAANNSNISMISGINHHHHHHQLHAMNGNSAVSAATASETQASAISTTANGTVNQSSIEAATTTTPATITTTSGGKKKKKKAPKEKKPRPKPGEIRETKALDGSTLYCCPECQMAYPDRSLIEQHIISHAVERRFVCDICNAALKRKDHLTRHKLSHIPDRPHVCNVSFS